MIRQELGSSQVKVVWEGFLEDVCFFENEGE